MVVGSPHCGLSRETQEASSAFPLRHHQMDDQIRDGSQIKKAAMLADAEACCAKTPGLGRRASHVFVRKKWNCPGHGSGARNAA
jgi:hypothetical protein